MAGALATAPVDNGRIRRLQNGSYVDTATGKRYASYKDIPKGKANFGDPAAMRSSIRSNMGPSTAAYDTTGAPDVLDYMSGNTDILGALGATPVTNPGDQIPMAGASAARNPQQPARPVAAGPQGALSVPAPMAASTGGGADSSSPIPMVLPSVRGGQAAHMPGPGGALSPTPDTEAAPVVQGDSGGDMLSAGLGALKGKGAFGGTAFGAAKGDTPTIKGAVAPSSSSGGALSSAPDVTKGLDLTSGLGALSEQNHPTTLGKDPNLLERIGGALGLRDSGPNSTFADNGANLTSLMSDPDRMSLLEMGLGTMAAAGQPGATLGGALGQGGLGAVGAREYRQERADKTKEAQLRLDTETARYNADREERAQFHGDENRHWNDTNTRETNRDKAVAAQALVANTQKDRELDAAASTEAAREKDSAAARGIQGKEAATAAARESRESQGADDKGYSDTYDNYLKSQKTNSTNSLDALLNPTDATRLDQDASWHAATQFPKATQSRAVASQVILRTQGEVQKNGGVMTPAQKATIAQARAILAGKR